MAETPRGALVYFAKQASAVRLFYVFKLLSEGARARERGRERDNGSCKINWRKRA